MQVWIHMGPCALPHGESLSHDQVDTDDNASQRQRRERRTLTEHLDRAIPETTPLTFDLQVPCHCLRSVIAG